MASSEAFTEKSMAKDPINFEDLFLYAPDGHLITDLKANILIANHVTARLLNTPPEDIPGKSLIGFILADQQETFQEWFEHLTGPKDSHQAEFSLKPVEQPSFPVNFLVAPWSSEDNGDGSPTGYRWVMRDIREQVALRQALQQQTERYRLLQEIAAASNRATNLQEALQYAIDRICAFMKWPVGHAFLTISNDHQELIPTRIWHLEDPQRYRSFREVTEETRFQPGEGLSGKVLATGKPFWVPNVLEEKGFERLSIPEDRPVRAGIFFPILTGEEVAGVMEFFSEQIIEPDNHLLDTMNQIGLILGRVVERERSQEALRASEARFRRIFENTNVGFILIDTQGKIMASNRALQKMIGYTAEELHTKNVLDLNFPEDVDESRRLLGMIRKQPESNFRLDRRYVRNDGSTLWARVFVTWFMQDEIERSYMIGLVENITEQKRMQKELSEIRRRLLYRGEMERMMLARELHDGPLQDLHALTYNLATIFQDTQDEDIRQEYWEIKESLRTVIHSLRSTVGDLRPPALAPFGLEKAIHSHAARLVENYPDLSIHLDTDDDELTLDETIRLALYRIYQQAVQNVLRHSNAENLWIRLKISEAEVELEIQDDGKGFSTPTNLVDLVRNGRFGLVGAAERAHAMGGQLSVTSIPGEGTRVKAVVPKNPPEDVPVDEKPFIRFDGKS